MEKKKKDKVEKGLDKPKVKIQTAENFKRERKKMLDEEQKSLGKKVK